MWRWLLTRTRYRLQSTGVADVPAEGPALLIANHVAADDAVLLTASVGRRVWTAGDAAQTPDAVVARIREAVASAVQQPAIRQRLAELGAEPSGSSPDQMSALLKGQFAQFGPMVSRLQLE